ncbi:ATP-dependent Clp protease proteolytic subunit [Aureimonas mangrovi]|uniref:ATP-dependent Clp protease proteolytic subunit n=1 Tax=Aureimonas mangrovi TaxID=2758041 RepID=UPI00163DDD18|nr:ATP-dependent Clp protease proteolytic subunit [Aureimonas mangrovi]
MIGEEPSPSRFERFVLSIPDGAILRGLFVGVIGLTGWVLSQDVVSIYRAESDRARTMRTQPMPLSRPIPGDQIRPYLPRTIPVGPDRGEPELPGYDGPAGGEAMSQPMRFAREPGSEIITAVGRIDPGTASLLESFLEGEGQGAATLYLHSPGGSVQDAIAMARAVRDAEMDTVVPDDGYCASACPLLFAGGVERTAGENAWVGLHQVYAVEIPGMDTTRDLDRSIADIQSTTADCQELLVDMGVDPRAWIHAMRTPSEELYVLTPEELSELAFVTTDVGDAEEEDSEASPAAG